MATPDAEWQAIHKIADRLAPTVRRQFLGAWAQLRGSMDPSALAKALAAGKIRDVEFIAASVPEHLRPVVETLNKGFAQGGQTAATFAGPRLKVNVTFQRTMPEAQQAAERNAARLVTNVTRDTRLAIREVVARGFREQRTVDEMAQDIRGLIGLTRADTRTVLNYQRGLRNAGVPPDEVERKVAALASKKLNARAVTIARTETINSANQGQLALWRQMQADKQIGSAMWKTWIITPDDRLCERCGALEGQAVPLEKPFEHPDGSVVECPTLHPRCRCAMGLTAAPKKKKGGAARRRRGTDWRRVGLQVAGANLLFSGVTGRHPLGMLVQLASGKTVSQLIGPWLFGPRRLVGMALPYLRAGRILRRFDPRLKQFIADGADLRTALKAGEWTPRTPSPMWEVGEPRAFRVHEPETGFLRPGPQPVLERTTERLRRVLMPDSVADAVKDAWHLNAPPRPVTGLVARTRAEELAKFVTDRMGLGQYVDAIKLSHPLEGSGAFSGAFNPRTRTLILSSRTTERLIAFMATVATGTIPGWATDDDAFLALPATVRAALMDPLLNPRTYKAFTTIVHELLHAYTTKDVLRGVTGPLAALRMTGSTRFIEEGLVEHLARRYAGAMLYGKEWPKYKAIPGLEAALKATEAYVPFTTELGWYEDTFGTEALYRLFNSPYRGEIAVDQIRGWLPHALATHPDESVRLAAERLLFQVEQADFREVLEWWQNGTFRRLHALSVEEINQAFRTQIPQVPKVLPQLPEVPLEVVRAIDVLTKVAAVGAETKVIYDASKNFVRIYRTATTRREVLLRGTGELLDAAEALISIVDRRTVAGGGSFDDSRALASAIVSVAQAGRAIGAFARGELTGIAAIDGAADVTKQAEKFVTAIRAFTPDRAAGAVEAVAATLTLINPAIGGAAAIARGARAVRLATTYLGNPVEATRRAIAAIRGELLTYDPNQKALVAKSARFWDNLRRGEWTPTDKSLRQTPRSLILSPHADQVGPLWDNLQLDGTPTPRSSLVLVDRTYDVESFTWMVADLMGVSWRINKVVYDSVELVRAKVRAAWSPTTLELHISRKETPRIKWLMAHAHDPTVGTELLAKANPELLFTTNVIVHELSHVLAFPAASHDPLDRLIVEGLNELHSRRASTALFYGRDYHLFNDKRGMWNQTSPTFTDHDRKLRAGAYPDHVEAMRILEDTFGVDLMRQLYLLREPRDRMAATANLLRAWIDATAQVRYESGRWSQMDRTLVGGVAGNLHPRALIAAMLEPNVAVPGTNDLISLIRIFDGIPDAAPILQVLMTAAQTVPPEVPGGPRFFFPDPLPPTPPTPTPKALAVRTRATYDAVYTEQLQTSLGLEGASRETLEQELATLPDTVRVEVVKDAQRVATFAADPLRHLRPFEPPLDPPIFLDRLKPSTVNKKWVEVPFPVLDDATALELYKATDTHVGTLQYVPLEKIVATQATVTKAVVYDKLASPVAPLIPREGTKLAKVLTPTKNPNEYRVSGGYTLDAVRAIEYEGRFYVTDGTHRSVAAWARGDKNVWAFVSRPTKTVTLTRDIRPSTKPIKSPFDGEVAGEHTPAAQQRLMRYLTERTGEQFKAHGSVARGVTSTNDVDIIRLPATHGMTKDQIRAYWAEQTKLAHDAEDEARALFEADVAGNPAARLATLALPGDDTLRLPFPHVGHDVLDKALGRTGYRAQAVDVDTLPWVEREIPLDRVVATQITVTRPVVEKT